MSARFAVFVLALSVGAFAQDRRDDVAFTTHDLSRSQIDTYPVTLNAGDFLRVDVRQDDGDVVVSLTDPDGHERLAVDTSTDNVFPETLVAIAEQSGRYTIGVHPAAAVRVPGRYSMRIMPPHGATTPDRDLIDAERAFAEGTRLLDRTRAAGWPESLAQFRAARRAYADAGDRRGEMKAIFGVARAQYYMDDAADLESARQSEQIAREVGDRGATARVLKLIGNILVYKADFNAALAAFDEAIAITHDLSDQNAEMRNLNDAALAYNRLGNAEQAIAMFERGLPLARATHDVAMESNILNNLGIAYHRLGEDDRALDMYEQSLANRRAAADPRGQMIALSNIGGLKTELGNPTDGLRFRLQALALATRIGDPTAEAQVVSEVADTELQLGDASHALDHQRAALATHQRINDVSGQAFALEGIGEALHRLGRLDDAAASVEQSLAIRRRIGEVYNEADSLHELARIERDRGAFANAVRYAGDAVRLDEELRHRITDADLRLTFRAHAQAFYELLVDLLQQHAPANAAAAALDVSERARARVLLESVVESRIDRSRYTALPEAEPLRSGDIQQRVLDDGTVLLEFALGDERSWLWAVTRDEIVRVELPPRPQIDAAARRAYQEISTRGAANGRAATALSRLLLGGVAQRLRSDWKGKRLAIVPSGSLGYVPFAALPAPDAVAGSPLVQGHELVIVPSASVMAALRDEAARRPAAHKDVAVVADPVFGTALPRLTFSRAEADAIAAFAPANAVTRSFGLDATRAAVLGGALNDYRIVHLATHGIVDGDHPAMSALVLSLVDKHGAPQDGYLRQRDIYGLRLNADLVVLSACQTALGKEVRGEGLMALTRAFMYAGTPRVIASLWEVGDRATAEFMRIFYQHLLREHMRPAAALRAAQLAMARNPRWSAPYYWAGFALHGDWR